MIRAAFMMVVIGLCLIAFCAPHAADYQMVKCNPGEPCEVAHIYYDNGGGACGIDAESEKIVKPGIRIRCERMKSTTEARNGK